MTLCQWLKNSDLLLSMVELHAKNNDFGRKRSSHKESTEEEPDEASGSSTLEEDTDQILIMHQSQFKTCTWKVL